MIRANSSPYVVLLGCLAATIAPSTAGAAGAGEAIAVVVLRENGAGSAASAQKYVDQVMQSVARVNGWSAVEGKYFSDRKLADAWIDSRKPSFGILSLGAFLAWRRSEHLDAVGKAYIQGGGGEQYYVVSKTATDLAGCQGQTLATNHAADEKFVDRVVSGGDFRLAEFKLQKTTRPLQTLKAVIRGEAACALIDDAQMADLGHVEGGDTLRPVWFSARFVPMVVVDLPTADKAAAKSFAANLPKVCEAEGKAACDAAGIRSLERTEPTDLADAIAAYAK